MKIFLTAFVVMLFLSLTTQAQHHMHHVITDEANTEDSHQAHVSGLLSAYLNTAKALYSDDFKAAKEAAEVLKNEVEKGSTYHEGEQTNDTHSEMLTNVRKAAVAEDMISLRAVFIPISNHVIELIKNYGAETELYVQFCPMADANKGAYWLSGQKEILNPYFGSMMLKCGSVKETIKPKG